MSKKDKVTDVIDEKAENEKLAEQRKQRPNVYRICKGKSVVCLKGVLAEGADMKPEYLSGGEASMKALAEKGVIESVGN